MAHEVRMDCDLQVLLDGTIEQATPIDVVSHGAPLLQPAPAELIDSQGRAFVQPVPAEVVSSQGGARATSVHSFDGGSTARRRKYGACQSWNFGGA